MPSKALYTIGKKNQIHHKTMERYWNDAKKSADKQGFEDGTEDYYKYVMGIVMKRVGYKIKEEKSTPYNRLYEYSFYESPERRDDGGDNPGDNWVINLNKGVEKNRRVIYTHRFYRGAEKYMLNMNKGYYFIITEDNKRSPVWNALGKEWIHDPFNPRYPSYWKEVINYYMKEKPKHRRFLDISPTYNIYDLDTEKLTRVDNYVWKVAEGFLDMESAFSFAMSKIKKGYHAVFDPKDLDWSEIWDGENQDILRDPKRHPRYSKWRKFMNAHVKKARGW